MNKTNSPPISSALENYLLLLTNQQTLYYHNALAYTLLYITISATDLTVFPLTLAEGIWRRLEHVQSKSCTRQQ